MPLPPYVPQLPELVSRPPEGAGWVHELKLDGYRFGCFVEQGRARLQSRNGRDWTRDFPAISAAAARLPVREALLDGELVYQRPDGSADFGALRGAVGDPRAPLTFFVFDLLHLDGVDWRSRPLLARKEALASLLASASPQLRYTEHFATEGRAVFEAAAKLGAEGIVSKRAVSTYAGARSRDWQKTKAVTRQELVVGGYLVSAASPLAALLLGVYDDQGQLVFAGKVGTGFQRVERELKAILATLAVSSCPYGPRRPTGADFRDAHWTTPSLVVEVEFLSWGSDGRLRHPTFRGLRSDKDPREVKRERPEDDAG